MSDHSGDDPTRAWRPGDDTQPAAPSPSEGGEATRAWPSGDDPAAQRVFVPAPDPADATRVGPTVGPAPHGAPAYAEYGEQPPRRSNGPLIAIIVLLALILGVGGALLYTAVRDKASTPGTSTTTTATTTTAPSTSTTATSTTTTTAPSTTATTTAPTTAPTTTTTAPSTTSSTSSSSSSSTPSSR